MTKFVGLVGKCGSGKDTIADIIVENKLADDRVSFASHLKYHCQGIFKETNREYLQKLGHACREIQKDVWINRVIDAINWTESIFQSHDANWEGTYVITDVRYLNEADWIINQDGILIMIDTGWNTRRVRIEKRDNFIYTLDKWDIDNSHISETEVNDIYNRYSHLGYIFNNDKELSDEALTDKFLKWYGENING